MGSPVLNDSILNFSFLDQTNTRQRYLVSGSDSLFQFFVEGVRCTKCLWKIEGGLKDLLGVRSARLNMSNSILTVDLDTTASLEQIALTLVALGFRPHPIRQEGQSPDLQTQANRQMLIRIGLSGFCTGNIMLLSFSLYSGATDSPFRSFFEWASAVIFLPVLTYAAWPFYTSLYRALKSKRPSIDLPIVAALWVGTGLSFHHFWSKAGDVYFDSLSMLVFLLLSSRYFLTRLHQRFLAPSLLKPFLDIQQAHKVTEQEIKDIPIDLVQVGDIIEVRSDEKLPVDGILISPRAHINAAILTGEHRPQKVSQNETVYAGTLLIDGPIRIKVTSTGGLTRLGRLLGELENELLSRTPMIQFTDKVAQVFTFVVLCIGVAFFIGYSFIDSSAAAHRALALAILACPCALAFATPLTQSLALMRAARRGYFIKNADALERLRKVRQIFFDKTGTLTEGELFIRHWLPQVPDENTLALIKSLETISSHPVAKAIRREIAATQLPELEKHVEITGQGVQANYQGDFYELKATTLRDDIENEITTAVGFYKNGQLQYSLVLGDKLKADSKDTISKLKAMNYSCGLISGDNSPSVNAVAKELNLNSDLVFAEASPEHKRDLLHKYKDSLMIGDGVNDSVAMASSLVSIAVHGSMESSLKAADIYLADPGIHAIPELIEISTETFYVIKRNLGFSLAYNLIGGGLALLGYIHPIIAAIMMPLSSATVVLSALIGTTKLRALSPVHQQQIAKPERPVEVTV